MEEPFRITFYDIALMGAALGFLIGLVPLVFGIVKKKAKYGVIGLVGSVIGGGILGVFLSIPIAAVCLWLILRKEEDIVPVEESSNSETASDSDITNSENTTNAETSDSNNSPESEKS